MASNDYIKFVTQQIVSYMDQPKEQRQEQKQKKKQERLPMSSELFGMIPASISMLFKKNK
jgi:hypothetical protein